MPGSQHIENNPLVITLEFKQGKVKVMIARLKDA